MGLDYQANGFSSTMKQRYAPSQIEKKRGKKRKKMLLAGFSTAVAGLVLRRWK
jgi:hypothetical protein